uniref:Uncharacterized protein n=1 Tax=Chrysotila carterae TaxID=13221 RepID=A0A7S4BYZ2_CHRCT
MLSSCRAASFELATIREGVQIAFMEVRGSVVCLLSQARQEAPMQALASLSITPKVNADISKSSGKSSADSAPGVSGASSAHGTSQLLLHCLAIAHTLCTRKQPGTAAAASQLAALLGERVLRPLRGADIAARNRQLFFCAVASADAALAKLLLRAGAIEALCSVLQQVRNHFAHVQRTC